jgi:hypothetical protein
LCDNCGRGKPKLIWASLNDSPVDAKKATVKVRLLTGTYTLQANKAKLNQNEVDPLCRVCQQGAEDRKHFLLSCSASNDIRETYLGRLFNILNVNVAPSVVKTITDSDENLLQLLLDCTKYEKVFPENNQDLMLNIETLKKYVLCPAC